MEINIYSYDEAFNASYDYFNGDELAARVWVNKYALKDSYGNIYEKTPDDMHHRLASELARIESKYKNPLSETDIFNLMKDFKYIVPQGSPMAGIGNNYQVGSLSNCFVIGLDGAPDSYGGIIKIDEEQVQLMKRRGGVGHDLSHVRPKGSPVKNSALTSTGLVPFMERYSNSTREVAQDGRRGALMLSVSIKHPDSEAFIDAKMTEGKVTGANVSVRVDDEFMRAAETDAEYEQKFPQARLLYLYMYAHPGKKLLFMGSELGQLREWTEEQQQDWDILKYPIHDAFYHYMLELSVHYRQDFLLFLRGNADAFQCLPNAAVRANGRLVVRSGKCRNTGVGFSAKWADCRNWLIRFHGGTPPVR